MLRWKTNCFSGILPQSTPMMEKSRRRLMYMLLAWWYWSWLLVEEPMTCNATEVSTFLQEAFPLLLEMDHIIFQHSKISCWTPTWPHPRLKTFLMNYRRWVMLPSCVYRKILSCDLQFQRFSFLLLLFIRDVCFLYSLSFSRPNVPP